MYKDKDKSVSPCTIHCMTTINDIGNTFKNLGVSLIHT